MAITYVAQSATAYSTADPIVTLPAGIQTGDLIIVLAGSKPDTAGPASIPSFTSLGAATGGTGTTGIDTGPTRSGVLYKESLDGVADSSSSITVSIPNNSVSWAKAWVLRKGAGEEWVTPVLDTGVDTTGASAAYSATGAGLAVASGDYVIASCCIPTDACTVAVDGALTNNLTQTGVVFGTTHVSGNLESSLGQDIGGHVRGALATSGSGTAGLVYTVTFTGSTNTYGPTAFARFRVSSVTSINGSDIGTGDDTGALEVTLTGSDTGTGADSGVVDLGIIEKSGSDTVVGADGGTLLASLSSSDIGALSDLNSPLSTALTGLDTSGSVEAYQLAVTLQNTEVSSSLESGSLGTGNDIAGTDTVTGADAATLVVTFTAADLGSLIDVIQELARTGFADMSVGTDSQSLDAAGAVSGSDSVVATDIAFLSVAHTAIEVGVGAESQTVIQNKSDSDSAQVTDVATLLAQLTVAEVISAAEVIAVLTGPQTWAFVSMEMRVVSQLEGHSIHTGSIEISTSM